MKKIYTIATLLLSSYFISAQWTTLTDDLYTCNSICFINPDEGWVAGWNGLIRKTSDGGNTWTDYFHGDSIYFQSIYFLDADVGYIGGTKYSGSKSWFEFIWKTDDGGQTWSEVHVDTLGSPIEIYFQDFDVGFAVLNGPNNIIRTTDGGNNWTTVYTGSSRALSSIHILDDIGYAVGWNGTILKSSDKGETWNNLSSGTDSYLHSIFMLNDTSVFVAGRGQVLKSSDGGQTWDIQYVGHPNYDLYSILFTDENNGYIATERGIHKTSDGGASWIYQDLGAWLNNLWFTDEFVGYACGWEGVYKTSDMGTTWTLITSQPVSWNNLRSVYFTDDDTGYAAGESGTIIKTTDGGNTWEIQNSGTDLQLNSLFFTGPETGYVAGGYLIEDPNWDPSHGIILKTTNGGESWTIQDTNDIAPLNSVYFVDSNLGFAAGGNSDQALIMKTVDGGVNWTKKVFPGDTAHLNELRSVFFIDGITGFAAGGDRENSFENYPSHPLMFATTDGGNNWFEIKSVPDTFCINSIFFTDKNTGYLAGAYDNGLTPYREILKTEDGGSSWNSIYSGGCETFKSIYFINRDTGYAVGTYECPDAAQTAAIWKTTDGGSTWVEEELKGSMGRPLNSVFFPDENTGYAVGYMGSILKTDDQTAGFSYDDPGTEQRLKIYPNPVSRTADIRYSISDIRYSNLSIFDAYGRLVETLVDGVQQPGEYTVSWNAENLPSGIYVFRLMAGDEVVSGKIIKR